MAGDDDVSQEHCGMVAGGRTAFPSSPVWRCVESIMPCAWPT